MEESKTVIERRIYENALIRMSNFGGLSVPVKEVMKAFAFISLLYF